MWLTCSILTSTSYICLLNAEKFLPELRPVQYTLILKRLKCEPYFWCTSYIIMTFNLLFFGYDILQMYQINHNARITTECFVITSKIRILNL